MAPYPPGVLATVTKPAGGSGVKHVATCVSGIVGNYSTSQTYPGSLELFDGSTLVLQWVVNAPVAPNGAFATGSFSLCDLNVSGSPNTPMTLKFSGSNNNVQEWVSLVGYDGQ